MCLDSFFLTFSEFFLLGVVDKLPSDVPGSLCLFCCYIQGAPSVAPVRKVFSEKKIQKCSELEQFSIAGFLLISSFRRGQGSDLETETGI